MLRPHTEWSRDSYNPQGPSPNPRVGAQLKSFFPKWWEGTCLETKINIWIFGGSYSFHVGSKDLDDFPLACHWSSRQRRIHKPIQMKMGVLTFFFLQFSHIILNIILLSGWLQNDSLHGSTTSYFTVASVTGLPNWTQSSTILNNTMFLLYWVSQSWNPSILPRTSPQPTPSLRSREDWSLES